MRTTTAKYFGMTLTVVNAVTLTLYRAATLFAESPDPFSFVLAWAGFFLGLYLWAVAEADLYEERRNFARSLDRG